ncbi:flagellar export protein FliJ [bacterium]|nr:flagellar export protein FliJ [bacterium]
MKKFKFGLAKVLTQREIVADLAQKNFVEAQAALDAEISKLNEMITVKERSLSDRAAMIQTSTDWVNQVDQINKFLIGQDLRIKNQNLRLQEAENLVESRREILRQAVSEVKILERLEDKQKKAHMAEAVKVEQAELDEIAVLRFSRNENLIKGSHEDGI